MDWESSIKNNSGGNEKKFLVGVFSVLLLQLFRNQDDWKEDVIPDLLKHNNIRKDIENLEHIADSRHDFR